MSEPLWVREMAPSAPIRGSVATEVCVVGLGAAGLHALLELARRGADAVGLEATRIGSGASGRNGGFLLAGAASFHHRTVRTVGRRRAVAMHRATLAELDRLESEMPDVVRRVGSLRIAGDEAELADCDAHLTALRADGLAGEPYEGPEGRGILLPDDASFDPGERIRRLAEEVRATDVTVAENSPATVEDGTTVRTPHATVTARRVIVAVDGGLEAVLPELRGEVRTARAQMLATAPALPPNPRSRPVYARHGYDYWQQLPDGRLVVGGGRDLGGSDEWTPSGGTSPRVQAHLEVLLRDHIGLPDPEITHRWSGSIALTSDRLPFLREVRPGVIACGAYSGTGNLIGPIAARGAVTLALDGDPGEARPFRWS